VRIIGSFVSPYVRKVLACLELKGLDYEVDPITPFFGNDAFERLSPLRRIPVMIDDEFVLTDSSIICEYLDETYKGYALLPSAPRDRARARWLEEYADSRLGDLFIWGLFYPKMVHPRVWGEPGDMKKVEETLAKGIPAALDYLEREVPADGFLFGKMCVADIAIASFFRNAAYADFAVDAGRWPKVAHFVHQTLAHPVFEKLLKLEQIQLGTSIAGRRQALIDAGARLTAETLGEKVPRPGIMRL
jgi:glutathione S-transferase